MKTIVLCLALGALLFVGSVGCVRARLQEPAPTPAATPRSEPVVTAVEVVEEVELPIEAAVTSRIDLRRWTPPKKAVEYRSFSRAYPQGRPPKAPSRID